jgi:hypothetical protein
LSEKITKAAQKLKPCFRSHYDNAGSLAVYCDFIGIKTHYRVWKISPLSSAYLSVLCVEIVV